MSKNTAKAKSEEASDLAALASEMKAMRERMAAMEAENARLKAEKESGLTLKTSKYGALQINGLRQGYVGFYRDEWEKLLSMVDRIRAYLDEHTDQNTDLPGGPGTDAGEFAVLEKHDSYQHWSSDARKQ